VNSIQISDLLQGNKCGKISYMRTVLSVLYVGATRGMRKNVISRCALNSLVTSQGVAKTQKNKFMRKVQEKSFNKDNLLY
jgi:hypothetical protein